MEQTSKSVPRDNIYFIIFNRVKAKYADENYSPAQLHAIATALRAKTGNRSKKA